jgi:tetratricopeptide (TPR) repeat protein
MARDNRGAQVEGNSIRSFWSDFSQILSDRLAWYVFAFFSIALFGMLFVSQLQMLVYVFFMEFRPEEKTLVHGGGMVAAGLAGPARAAVGGVNQFGANTSTSAGLVPLSNVVTLSERARPQSLARDPFFSRALGGLSFTHFQNAFLSFDGSPEVEMEEARSFAHRALEADQYDPFAHFNVGRSFWLDGQLEDAIAWFDKATSLSPSYAQGIYNRGLVSTMAGKPTEADADLALALELSPLDPLAYAMISSRALAHVQFGDYEKAAEFGSRAARMPGAHKHIALIAAFTAHLAGHSKEAMRWLAHGKAADPDLNAKTFFHAFPFANNAAREVIEKSMADLGL